MSGEEPDTNKKSADPTAPVFSWLAGATKVLLWVLAVLLVGLNFGSISDGVRGLAERLPDIAKVSVGEVSVEMDPKHIEDKIKASDLLAQSDRDNWGAEQSKNAADGLRKLDKRSLMRLMNVGLLANVCRFPKPTTEMLFDYADDQSLEENKLVKISPNAETLEKVLSAIRERARSGKSFALGFPTECYDLSLTGKGHDVRSWLTHWLAAGFGPTGASAGARR